MASRVGIVGASGYSGAVLARLVAGHPKAKLAFLTSDKHAGLRARDKLGGFFDPDLVFSPNVGALDLAPAADVVFLATSAEVSAALAPSFADRGKLTIDLSGAFRLADAAAYEKWYGLPHPAPSYLRDAFYGLPELFGAPPDDALIISNPGCYATAAILAIAPLVRRGLIEPAGIVADGKSGVSGAGRRASEDYSFVEVNEDVRAYRIGTHQHTPEIEGAVARSAGAALSGFSFVPHLLPLSRGLSVSVYAKKTAQCTEAALARALEDAYATTSFVRVVPASEVSVHAVAGTNFAHVGAALMGSTVAVFAAIDNLLKGAAGQALQNMNLALGHDETLGLRSLARISP